MTKAPEPILLDHRVDLYIPSQCLCTSMLPEALRGEVIEDVKTKFDEWFGGHAEITIKGDWRLPDGTIAKEEVADIFSFCTQEALETHAEDVDELAVEIANRLTQDRVLRVFDNLQIALWPNTIEALIPKKNCACKGEALDLLPVSTRPEPIKKIDQLSRMLIIQGILRSFNSVDHARKVFCDVLNYQYATGELPCASWPDGIRSLLTGAPTLLADHNGFKVLYLRISGDELRRGSVRQVIQRICKDDPTFRGLFVVSDQSQKSWEFINVKARGDDSKRLLLRLMRVGVEAVRTATERIATLQINVAEEDSIAAEELESRHDQAFDVESVTKAFFADVANWYFWALKHVRFPKDAPKEKDGHDHVSVIRLITRLVFCWFVKEKGLIPADLFYERKLADLLVGFAPGNVSNADSVFYKAILQNLFFATLNTEMKMRDWRRNGQNFMAHSLYRYKDLFARPNEALALFKNIPFLNGGLFECLDRILGDKAKPYCERIDGFSDREDSQPTVPDFLFFGEERELDLSSDYGDKKFKKVRVRGLIHTLNHYRFTVEESTPLEEEVALDPELAGKIFENLLAAYNPETGATARKQTGSFYTPREIVNYMVDESLIAYLKGKLEGATPNAADVEPRLRHLFSYEDEGHRFTGKEVEILIAAIDQLKALDPAVGSGAFPMGILLKLVFVLGRLDPRNERWKERQTQRLRDAIITAERIEDGTIRENTLRELEQQIVGIDDAFEKNALDYGRKLYLIENCLYGVDIQPIAVQIAKMRFFISLIADQKVDPSAENCGVRPLPNLETKLVAANTLIGIDRPKQMTMRNPRIGSLEVELRRVRERHFLARTPTTKDRCREQDQKLRIEIAELLKKDRWPNATAKQLAGWDPYDQNASSGFFDSEWMFGVQEGFDVVIGNPPYVRQEAIKEQKPAFQRAYECFTGTADLYVYFYERGVKLLKASGILSYISSNKWYRAAYGEKLRKWLGQQTRLLRLIDFGDAPVFTAIAYPTIVLTRREPSDGKVETLTWNPIWPLNEFEARVKSDLQHMPQCELKPDGWRLESPVKLRLLERLRKAGTPFGKYVQGRFYRGILTGLNEAFVVDRTTRDRLIAKHPSSKEVLKPFLRGRDVKRWRVEFADTYLIKIESSENKQHPWSDKPEKEAEKVFARTYPAIHSFFDDMRKLLIDRYDQGKYFWELRSCAYWLEFEQPKVIYPNICSRNEFAWDELSFYANQKTFIIPGVTHFLLGYLNSSVVMWLFTQLIPKLQNGFYEPGAKFLGMFPIPSATVTQQSDLRKRVTRILAAKKKDPAADVSTWEREVDEIVYKLYGLTRDEIAIVEDGK
jgi:adenine-specific DNA-methyltransferase